MTTCVEKLPHDKCGSRDALQVFMNDDGKYTAYCFSCGTYEPDPYKDRPVGYKPVFHKKTAEEIREEIQEISEYLTVDLKDRRLKKEALEAFGIKIGVSEEDGVTPIHHYYPYYQGKQLQAFKVRVIEDKRIWSIGDQKNVDLFGWQRAKENGARKLFITEGELDAVALYQIIKQKNKGTQYADMEPSVVSLAHGASGAAKDISRHLDEIRATFKEVVLVFDQDEAGQAAVAEVLKILPEAIVADLPEKDVNDCLIKGKANAAYNAIIFRSTKPKNTRIVSGQSLHEVAKVPAVFGASWPWKHLTKATKGIRLGETIYIGAGQKQGKSEIVNTLAAHFIKEHNWKVFLVKPEEANNKTYKLVAGKLVGKRFHDPDVEFDVEAYDKAGELIGENLFMLDLYQHVGWESLKADIRYAANEGCKAVIIDPITNLTNGMDAATANTKLQEIAQELSAMAKDLNIVIFIFCHLRNPESGLPHEMGGAVLSSQFAGSRAMARSCNLMLGLEGNRDPSLKEEQRNLRTLVLLEDREFGVSGRYGLYWDTETTLFNEC